MKRKLLSIACCPACHGELRLDTQDLGAEIMEGSLRCAGCARSYPIQQGVPNLVLEPRDVMPTKRRFEFQWKERFAGRAESSRSIFGHDAQLHIAWMCHRFGAGLYRLAGKGVRAWCLDAGCGSGEKTRQFAKLLPSHEIVGMDLSATLARSAQDAANVPNLHFVQADVRFPPFRRDTFHYAMSIAVLHHTPDTRQAFSAITGTVQPEGTFVTWIYPAEQEYPGSLFRWHYFQRDWLFMSRAHVLPARLGMMLVRLQVALLFFPVILPILRRAEPFGSLIRQHGLSLRQVYNSAVFFTFDNVMPPYQHRHSIAEVTRWYGELGFTDVTTDRPGFFSGMRAR